MKGGGRAHLAVGHRADKAAARYPAFTLALALAGCPVVVAGPGDWRPSFRPALPDAFTPMSPSAYHRAVPPSTAPAEDTLTPVEHVNIYTGTQPELNGISFGNVLPLVTVPWAFQSWFPQTRPSPASRWPFEASDERPGLAPGPQFYGMRATHQASPWVGDWGAFQLITTVGDDDAPSGHSPPLGKRRLNAWLNATAKKQASQRDVQNSHALLRARAMQRASQGWGVRPPWGTTPAQPTQTRFSHLDWRKSVAQPHLFTADLRDSESGGTTRSGLRPRESHAAVLEVQYDSAEARALPKRLTVNFHACSFIPPVNITARQTSPTEFAVVSRGGVCPEANCAVKFELHLALALSVAPISWRVSSLGPSVFKSTLELELSPGTRQLTARVGTSFISADLARLSLQRQVGGRGLEEVGKQGAARWNEVLSSATLDIVGNGKSKERVAVERATFYTNAYRASHFPRFIDEVSTDGSFVHWSPYTGRKPLAGRLVADSGFWDAYRTVYPWLSLTQPEVLGEMLQGWLNAASEWGGWLAQWASPGDAFSMGGSTLSDVVFSDAIAKGISGFDRSQAFRLLLRNAMDNSGGSGAQGRSAWPRQGRSKRLASESSPGYLPGKEEWGVSYNLETCYCNFAIARAAERLCADDVDTEATCLGRSGASLLAELDARAANYRLLFDDKLGEPSFQPRLANGSFVRQPMDQWGNSFAEAGPRQYRYYAPYDVEGLDELYKGKLCDSMEADLRRKFTGFYLSSTKPHELLEAKRLDLMGFGSLNHNNQVTHHWLYLMLTAPDRRRGAASCANRARHWISRVLQKLYGLQNYSGDEDNGEMSAWYLLSSIGLYPLKLGTNELVLGAPQFERVTLRLRDGKTLVVRRVGWGAASKGHADLRMVLWRRAGGGVFTLNSTKLISYQTILSGGELTFVFGRGPAAGL
eukprot:CAMPEP_0180019568 /NCGR_PEP_ID=MMETSP0984-20121128/21166_1 /TAXON_ID=483367 /ORGANISM="non described non described, Strain CCMP 2436" /LENGTH=927 /DNA_ID=CAMNT_0021943091 /DNA_START=124 /DNA_END=2908 /DNA_ORIENTATION=+